MSHSLRELDHRSNDGISVSLLWHERDDRVLVTVVDSKLGERFELEVRDGERALDVFHHPYAYAAWHAVDAEKEPNSDPDFDTVVR
jgi:uncharacterized protein (DUF952 family)